MLPLRQLAASPDAQPHVLATAPPPPRSHLASPPRPPPSAALHRLPSAPLRRPSMSSSTSSVSKSLPSSHHGGMPWPAASPAALSPPPLSESTPSSESSARTSAATAPTPLSSSASDRAPPAPASSGSSKADARPRSPSPAAAGAQDRSSPNGSPAAVPVVQPARATQADAGYTPSCSRCRAKKLRCNCETPCSNCISKGLQDECHKDRRIPRGRKRPRLDQHPVVEHEITTLRRKLRELESQSRAAPSSSTGSSSSHAAGAASYTHSAYASSPVAGRHQDFSAGRHVPHVPSPVLERRGPLERRGSALGSITSDGTGRSMDAGPSSWVPHDGYGATRSAAEALSSLSGPSSSHALFGQGSSSRTSLLAESSLPPPPPRSFQPLRPRNPTHMDATAQSFESLSSSRWTQGSEPHRMCGLALDRQSAYWTDPATLHERRALVEEVLAVAPELSILNELTHTFLYRANHFAGHLVHEPTFREATQVLMSGSVDEVLQSPLFADPAALAVWLLVLSLGWTFHPHNGPTSSTPGFAGVHAMRNSGVDPTRRWQDLARRALAVERTFAISSISGLQAACLFMLLGERDSAWVRMVGHVALTGAREMGLARLGAAACSADMSVRDFVRLETAVRIWNFLCDRDWCAGQRDGSYAIHRGQFDTRRPLNLNDADLEAGLSDSRPASEWTEMSYVLAHLDLAEHVRDAIDVRNLHSRLPNGAPGELSAAAVEQLDDGLRRYLQFQLPRFFALGSTFCQPRIAVPQRWMLHQQVFSQLLSLHRSSITTAAGRSTCLSVAMATLDLFAEIRTMCPVLEGLYVNSQHLFTAALILVLDMLHTTSHERRLDARQKVASAIENLANTPRSAVILEVLLEEEAALQQRRASRQDSPDTPLDLAAISWRISRALDSLPSTPPEAGRVPDECPAPALAPWLASSGAARLPPSPSGHSLPPMSRDMAGADSLRLPLPRPSQARSHFSGSPSPLLPHPAERGHFSSQPHQLPPTHSHPPASPYAQHLHVSSPPRSAHAAASGDDEAIWAWILSAGLPLDGMSC